MPGIPRQLPNTSLQDWNDNKPRMHIARGHMARVIKCAPAGWQAAMRERFGTLAMPLADADAPPEWAQAWDLMQAVADFQDEHGAAIRWNISDSDICTMAKKLAAEADELDALAMGNGDTLAQRVDSIRMLVRMSGITEDKPITGEPAIKRAQDAAWWRRRLRTKVARVVEGGHVRLGLVHKRSGGYVSTDGLQRRQAQLKRNAEALGRTLFRNEVGQVYTLGELAELGTANPVIRGGELMTRIRGAEEYADARAHVGLFLTLTLPSRFHPVKLGSGGRPIRNARYDGATPRDGQMWLRGMWQKTRAALARLGVRMYGLRVAEPHHDATPHWHMLVWAEHEEGAMAIESTVRRYWLSDDGDERGALENRINCKRMVKGGAAGYVAKYIAKSVGHLALAEHQDLVNGQQITMDFGGTDKADVREPAEGHRRVDAWAATWGLRQFQAFGMPSVTVWRELRRVTADQLELFDCEDYKVRRAYAACHRRGELRADWREYMEAMGGHALPRCRWHLRTAHRKVWAGDVNAYGEAVKVGRIVGIEPQHGRMTGHWLVSRRIRWSPVATGTAAAHASPVAGAEGAGTDPAVQAQGEAKAATRSALPSAWTGFNNCTARLKGAWAKLLSGRRAQETDAWPTTDPGTGEPAAGPDDDAEGYDW